MSVTLYKAASWITWRADRYYWEDQQAPSILNRFCVFCVMCLVDWLFPNHQCTKWVLFLTQLKTRLCSLWSTNHLGGLYNDSAVYSDQARPFPLVGNIRFICFESSIWAALSSSWGSCVVQSVIMSRKTSLYDCVGWLYSQLEHDGFTKRFLNSSQFLLCFLLWYFIFRVENNNNNKDMTEMWDTTKAPNLMPCARCRFFRRWTGVIIASLIVPFAVDCDVLSVD